MEKPRRGYALPLIRSDEPFIDGVKQERNDWQDQRNQDTTVREAVWSARSTTLDESSRLEAGATATTTPWPSPSSGSIGPA
jgi:hypothetical protein